MRPRWEILAELINKNNYTHIVEVGVSRGINACKVLELCPKIEKMYLVDISKDVFDIGMFTDAKVDSKIQFICLPSIEAVHHVPDELDLVFIDANHGYDECKRDIKTWLPKVRKGGIIAGHDYLEHTDYGVMKAVLELLEVFTLEDDVLENGNLKVWWTYK